MKLIIVYIFIFATLNAWANECKKALGARVKDPIVNSSYIDANLKTVRGPAQAVKPGLVFNPERIVFFPEKLATYKALIPSYFTEYFPKGEELSWGTRWVNWNEANVFFIYLALAPHEKRILLTFDISLQTFKPNHQRKYWIVFESVEHLKEWFNTYADPEDAQKLAQIDFQQER